MKNIAIGLFAVLCFSLLSFNDDSKSDFLTYTVSPKTSNLQMFYKDKNGKLYKNARKLKKVLKSEGKKLLFAVNGGMYQADRKPVGLYIEKGKIIKKINRRKNAKGNFYLQPNGIFYITKGKQAVVCKTTAFKNKKVEYATQSGPMLVIDGKIHSKFRKSSTSVHYRNGVGILPNGKVLFVQSKEKVNLYRFAEFFKSKGCKNALYLDGFVSKTYLPEKNWVQDGGHFGVMIGVTN
jgi:uncharacterized protein YigE (DUF2233 family)